MSWWRPTILERVETVMEILETGKSVEQVAHVLGIARTRVYRYRRMAHAPESIQALLRSGQCRSENLAEKLVARYGKSPRKVNAWAEAMHDSGRPVSEASIKELNRIIKGRGPKETDPSGRKASTALAPGTSVTMDGRRWTVEAVRLVRVVDERGEVRVVSRSRIEAKAVDEARPNA